MKKIIVMMLFFTSLFAIDASMEIVKKGSFTPKVALEDSTQNSQLSENFKKKFYSLLLGDFKVSGQIEIDNKDGYAFSNFEEEIAFHKYKTSDLLIKYKFELNNDKSLGIVMKIFDINSQKLASTHTYNVSKIERFPFLAHKMAIDVNNYLKAPPIDWMQKFVIFSKYTNARQSEIVVADYTLTYQQTVIKGGLNVFPKWASDKQDAFYYTSYEAKPTLYKVDLFTGKKSKIISSDGMLTCSDVSKDGTKLLLTMAPNDQPDIFLLDLQSMRTKKITNYKGIDVNGGFIDDENRIVFVSDRLGTPNIFAQSIDGGEGSVERLVYHGKNNNSCTTFKNYIVYVSRDTQNEFDKNSFNLYLISTKTDYIRQLTSSGVNQFPKFSPDGETVLFIKNQKNQSGLGIIRLNYNQSYLYPLNIGEIQSIDW